MAAAGVFAEDPVQLYDIKWPSVRSSFVQFPFTCAAYQWAWAGRILPSRAPVEDE
jgi:hypothetical protein